MRSIYFHYAAKKFRIPASTPLKNFIHVIFKKEKQSYLRVDYVFCSDRYLLDLNQKFLHHNYYTDVISFQLNKPNTPIVGEIYISIDRVKFNSRKYNCSLYNELLRVIIHGVLHLCGYTDKRKEDKLHMKEIENKYLDSFARFHVKQ